MQVLSNHRGSTGSLTRSMLNVNYVSNAWLVVFGISGIVAMEAKRARYVLFVKRLNTMIIMLVA